VKKDCKVLGVISSGDPCNLPFWIQPIGRSSERFRNPKGCPSCRPISSSVRLGGLVFSFFWGLFLQGGGNPDSVEVSHGLPPVLPPLERPTWVPGINGGGARFASVFLSRVLVTPLVWSNLPSPVNPNPIPDPCFIALIGVFPQ